MLVRGVRDSSPVRETAEKDTSITVEDSSIMSKNILGDHEVDKMRFGFSFV
jgi:hypothetical protein